MNTNNNSDIKLPFFGIPALLPYLKKYNKTVFMMIFLGILVSLTDAVFPLFNRYAINHFVGESTLDTLPYFVILYLGLVFIQAAFNYKNVTDCAKVEMYMDRDLRNNAFSHLQTVSLSYYNQNNVGYIHARAISDSGKIGEMLSWKLMDTIWFGSYILFVLIVMLAINWKLALYVIVLVPVAVLIISIFQKKLLVLNRAVREMNSVITADINEGITGVKSIKSLVIEDKMENEFYQDTDKMFKKAVRATHNSALFSASVSLIGSLTVLPIISLTLIASRI